MKQHTMQVYNTAAGQKETFEPIELPVKMYVCGLTPKNEPHLGHARLFVVNDTIRRYLEYRGYPVTYVQNFTDVDDKIIAAGLRDGVPPSEAARRYTESYFRDMDRLGVRRADIFTYVTEFIPNIIAFVQGLIDKGHAYVVDGDVYFWVPSFPAYGALSGRDEAAMLAGARIEPDERKRDPRDFALWKSAKPGEPWWESPWGRGRPGWHIECSTMAMETLGERIDIHGGGSDLIFPHHENEIAQTESLTGTHPFVRYWLHTGMLSLPAADDVEALEKMAHSGAFVTIRSLLTEGIPAPALRMYLLGKQYRDNFAFSAEQLRAFTARWRRWAEAAATLKRLIAWAEARVSPSARGKPGAAERELAELLVARRTAFVAAMDDDLNTSEALAAVDELVHRINDYSHGIGERPTAAILGALRESQAVLEELSEVLGIALAYGVEISGTASGVGTASLTLTVGPGPEQIAAIEALIAQRAEARQAKNWAEADRIRKQLDEGYGVVLKDTPQGATWTLRQER